MSLQTTITTALKEAMKAKDQVTLEALRAIKSELLLAQTSGADTAITEAEEIKLLQKLVKQREDAASIFSEQNRLDLAEPELAQATVIKQFLPEQLSESEIEIIIKEIVSNRDRKSTRLNSSHVRISYAVFCLKKKKTKTQTTSSTSYDKACPTRRK